MRNDAKFQAALHARSEVAAILAVPALDATVGVSELEAPRIVREVWDYSSTPGRRVSRLYSRAKAGQWNVEVDLDWSVPVDPSAQVFVDDDLRRLAARGGGPMSRWTEAQWAAYGAELHRYTLDQFLHGEQFALLVATKIVDVAPTMDAKLFAATQVFDEARHVEVFSRYNREKLTGEQYPVTGHMKALCDQVLADPRWDITYLGMQVMVEGLALAMFGWMRQTTSEPLLADILGYVLRDEARHVAFGILSLREVFAQLSDAELRERQELVFEAALALRSRLVAVPVFERLDLPVERLARGALVAPSQQRMTVGLFARIVPICAQLGLLDAAGGWLRERFAEMGVLRFEHVVMDDTAGVLDDIAS